MMMMMMMMVMMVMMVMMIYVVDLLVTFAHCKILFSLCSHRKPITVVVQLLLITNKVVILL